MKNISKVLKTAGAAALAAVLASQVCVPAFAVESDNTNAKSFYYVALGDSVAAGFGVQDSAEFNTKNFQSMYVDRNYKNSPIDCYPALVADAFEESLKDTDISFDWSNMGTCSFMTKDYIGTINDEDHIADLFYQMFVARYENERLAYEADPQAYKIQHKEKVKALCDEYAENSDSEVAKTLRMSYGLSWKTYDEFLSWYEKFDESFENYFENTWVARITGENYKYHDLYVQELSKADLVSVNVGANDLLEQLMFAINQLGLGDDYTVNYVDGTMYYDNLANPVVYMVWQSLFSLMCGNSMDSVKATLEKQIKYYKDDITVEDVVELMQFMQTDNVKTILDEFAHTATDNFKVIVDDIIELNPDVDFAFIGSFAPFGTSYECDGKTYDIPTVTKDIIAIIFDEVFGCKAGDDGSVSANSAEPSTEEIEAGCDRFDRAVAELERFDKTTKNGSEMTRASLSNCKDKLNSILQRVLAEIQYPLMHLLLGEPALDAVAYFNSTISDYADSYGVPYIDIYDIPNENNFNPHPTAAGHKHIADKIINKLVNNVEVEKSDNGVVNFPPTTVYSVENTYTVTPNDGFDVESIFVNGNAVDFDRNDNGVCTFKLKADCEDMKITVNYCPAKAEHLIGDINDDKLIDATDITLLQLYVSGGYGEVNEMLADVNKDGKIDVNDISLIQQYISGKVIESNYCGETVKF